MTMLIKHNVIDLCQLEIFFIRRQRGFIRMKMYIGGKWVDSMSEETLSVNNPATGKKIGEVPKGTREDVNAAVDAARDADENQRRRPRLMSLEGSGWNDVGQHVHGDPSRSALRRREAERSRLRTGPRRS